MFKGCGLLVFISIGFLSGCATQFPDAEKLAYSDDGLAGAEIFAACLDAHGGDLREVASEVRLSLTGEWSTAITKIQPLVTDFEYRIDAKEIHWIDDRRSEVVWSGPAGEKTIIWDKDNLKVYYDDVESTEEDVLKSTAMTSNAFQLFHLGPSFLAWNAQAPKRLSDEVINGKSYYRLHFILEPGFGFSEKDEVIAYVDPQTMQLYRVWLTLEGFKTTKGATVDVTFLDYYNRSGVVLPAKLDERVRAPLSIHAHAWEITELEIIP